MNSPFLRAILVCYFKYKPFKIITMKYFITTLVFTLSFVYGKAQKIDSASVEKLNPSQREEVNLYLNQAKKAKTTAMVLSIGGATIGVVSAIIYSVAIANDVADGFDPYATPHNDASPENVAGTLMLVGAASALASIPFFVKVHKKREAARAIIYADKGVSPGTGMIIPHTQSAGISFVIEFGRRR
jgi:hypothetical protein